MRIDPILAADRSRTETDINENRIIKRISRVSIAGNVALSGFKLYAGVFGHSGAMVSDAVHSMSDVITTIVAFLGVKISRRPADSAHPYGHDRLECVAAMILGWILFLTGIGIGKTGVKNILTGNHEFLAVHGAIVIAAAVTSIIGKEAMYWYTRYYAGLIGSDAFMADARHHRSDAVSSVGALIGIGGAMMGFPVLDSAASVGICLFILKVSWDIVWDAVKKMLDTSCGEDFEKKLTDYVDTQEGVLGVDLLRTRMFGNKVYIDLEIEVDGEQSLRAAHAVAECIHNNLEAKFPQIKHVMIHVNPGEGRA